MERVEEERDAARAECDALREELRDARALIARIARPDLPEDRIAVSRGRSQDWCADFLERWPRREEDERG